MIDIQELNNEARTLAIENGLCEKWQDMWAKDWPLEKMVHMFYRGIDFFISTRFLPDNKMVEWVGTDFMRENGILVNDRYSLVNPSYVITTGKTETTIRMNANNAATIYLCDDSTATLEAKNRSFVIVHLYGNATLKATASGDAHVCAIVHSDKAKVIDDGNIVIKNDI